MTTHQSLFDSVRAQRCIDPQDAAAVAKNGGTVDTQQYDGVAFILSVGTVTTSVDMKAQQGDASNGSDAADIAGAAITQLGAADELDAPFVHRQRGAIVSPVRFAGSPR